MSVRLEGDQSHDPQKAQVEIGIVLAGQAAVLGSRCATKILDELRSHTDTVPITPSVEAEVTWRCMALCFFLIDRAASHYYKPDQFEPLMQAVRNRFIDFVAETPTQAAQESIRQALHLSLREHTQRWTTMPFAPVGDGQLTGTLFWEFGEEIANLANRAGNMEAIGMVLILAGGCIDGLDTVEPFSKYDRAF